MKVGESMLKVIKKNGQVSDFIPEKIAVSIYNSGNDINFNLNQKDLDLITKEIENKLIAIRGVGGITSSYEIATIILLALKNAGYSKVADSFYRGINEKINR